MSVRLAAAAIAATLGFAAPAQADIMVGQEPCGGCFNFQHNTPIDNFHKTLGFNAPAKGKALVSVSGTLYCFNNDSLRRGFLVYSRLVKGDEAVQPGLPQSGAVMNTGTLAANSGLAFNLAVSRVFAIDGPGKHYFRLRLKRSTQFPGTNCSVFNTALAIHYTQQ